MWRLNVFCFAEIICIIGMQLKQFTLQSNLSHWQKCQAKFMVKKEDISDCSEVNISDEARNISGNE